MVLLVGDSGLTGCKAEVERRTKRDSRVRVEEVPGKGVRDVMGRAQEAGVEQG